jgi:hypothetical protein
MLLTPDGRGISFVEIIRDLIVARYSDTDTIELDLATGRYSRHRDQLPYEVLASRLNRVEQIRTVAVYSLEVPRFQVGLGRLSINQFGAITYVGTLNYNAFKDANFDSATQSDFDDDGIPDGFEAANGLDAFNPVDAFLDDDFDGLFNLDEFFAGTDPQEPDSDEDGIIDGLDEAPGVASNLCAGDDAILSGVTVLSGAFLTCGAKNSVQIDTTVVSTNGALQILSPTVKFQSGTRVEAGAFVRVTPIDPSVPNN